MVFPAMPIPDKREVDHLILAEWIDVGARVLDLGCGRGVLLEDLARNRQARCVGVDIDGDKIRACVRRGVDAYQGDMLTFMAGFPDKHFDYVVCSRTIQELPEPGVFLREGLRVGRRLAVGFVNFGYWKNRLALAWSGARLINEVHPQTWDSGRLQNPVSLLEFDAFVAEAGLRIRRRVVLRGDWRTPCRWFPNLRGGYALYELETAPTASILLPAAT
jgi:methionine biosynthesis protein MetW